MTPEDLRTELERLHLSSYAWALQCCRRRPDEAEEVLQEVYLMALDGRARFDGRSSTKTWLFGVIRLTARQLYSRRWRRSLLLERWHITTPAPSLAPDPELLSAQAQHSQKLRDALTHLPRRQRELVHLVFYQDLTIEEAALTLGISLGSARTHFERGKQRLRGFLGAIEQL